MFLNTHQLSDLIANELDVFVAGTGPAGITTAIALAERGITSLLIESGGYDIPLLDEGHPYQGLVKGRPYPLETSRLSVFGGTSNHWGGWCRPLDPVDFDRQPETPYSGWPIRYSDLAPWYAGACRVLQLGKTEFSLAETVADGEGSPPTLTLAGTDFESARFQFSPPTRFAETYGGTIRNSPYIHCSLNTRLMRVERDATRSICVIRQPDGRIAKAKARSYVLALGGLENARTLLWSNVNNPRPFVDASDWIGGGFVDHFGAPLGKALLTSGLRYGQMTDQGLSVIVPSTSRGSPIRSAGYFINLTAGAKDGMLGQDYLANRAIFPTIARRGWHYTLGSTCGHRPNKGSRVSLDKVKDIHGIPRLCLDWRIPSEDLGASRNGARYLAQIVGRSGQGRIQLVDAGGTSGTDHLSVGCHHIGTTRMALTPEEGVVDGNCRVFGTTDLYVAGSSVFPTSGYANPTLTIVAMALRLAEHLATVIRLRG